MIDFKRTGTITMRSADNLYLIIRYPTCYKALHGSIGTRSVLGDYRTSEEAISACNDHAEDHATVEKKPPE